METGNSQVRTKEKSNIYNSTYNTKHDDFHGFSYQTNLSNLQSMFFISFIIAHGAVKKVRAQLQNETNIY